MDVDSSVGVDVGVPSEDLEDPAVREEVASMRTVEVPVAKVDMFGIGIQGNGEGDIGGAML
jgi:hypothetical protein